MSVEILQNEAQIVQARKVLLSRKLSCTDTRLMAFGRRLRLIRTVEVGDELKSWDVLKTITFIEKHVAKESPILDIGAYASEVLCSLRRLGYSNLTGVDLNPLIAKMPYAGTIKYVLSDFMRTPFPDASFDAITAISVIEHGYHEDRLLGELSRLLKPGGIFIASMDYWPEKIDTAGISAFGMEWRIFSREDIKAFLARAAEFGFSPVGVMNLSASTPLITWNGKSYTFCWFAITKRL